MGFPGGKFQLRPVQFCHLDAHGCHKLPASRVEFEDFGINKEAELEVRELMPEDIKRILEDEVPKLIEKDGLQLSELLKDISSDDAESFSSVEKKVLELAADILAASNSSNPKVLSENFDFTDLDL